jgi:hypothetical protein
MNDSVAYVRYVIWVGASEGPEAEELAPCERRGGSGRKLQALAGRCATRRYICAIRDCWVCVSCCWLVGVVPRGKVRVRRGSTHQLCVEFCQSGLAIIIEDEDCVDHLDWYAWNKLKRRSGLSGCDS